MKNNVILLRKIRSFMIRRRKLTKKQQIAINNYWLEIGIEFKFELINFTALFKSNKPVIIEVGFGMGNSLVAMAQDNPDQNFLGVEVYLPGVCNCIAEVKTAELRNLRIIYHDITEVLENMIPDNSIHKVQLFCPDPWPKTRHHKRRIINLPFINLVNKKLNSHGSIFHIVTDCENYAHYIIKLINSIDNYRNQSSKISKNRPITKFEQRGKILGHKIWDLIFEKNNEHK
ncbi:tRNA (guanosine(46)-N7)-methyltransferase TrmB [Candidatus Pantoea edessiphila]|uniref:tRNA (guanine-N(7)-)-methyltransferase n=1 Tax=Candidatus Pantoea edessiphila TaxID=2044610 RepID=A0A2P5SVW8_9GAMM|nr:tRNA (guanosine(46)-N7)-methyltransferase TrmB [Candidatus Pantoea edessiphila]PPI86463.1 tRNA (guanosine(46)-N7)-methyltransferase TrmB [Candidatus Pantoea edessiphila]